MGSHENQAVTRVWGCFRKNTAKSHQLKANSWVSTCLTSTFPRGGLPFPGRTRSLVSPNGQP